MLQQSGLNKSESFNSEFRTSMLKRLSALRSPTFDCSISLSASALSCRSPSNSTSSGAGAAASQRRRRRFYQSPGPTDVLSPARRLLAGTPKPRVKAIGAVLEERAKLVKKTLASQQNTSSSNGAHVLRSCSTPVRSSFSSTAASRPLCALDRGKRPATGDSIGTTGSSAASQNLFADLSNISNPFANSLASTNKSVVSEPVPKRQKYNSLLIFDEANESERHSASVNGPRPPATLQHGNSSVVDTIVEDIKLDQFSFTRGRGRTKADVVWMEVTCTLIKNLVHRQPQSSDDLGKCRCLQMALRATKVVDPVITDTWLSEFSDRVTELLRDVNRCPFHVRLAKPHERVKLNVERAEKSLSDGIWKALLVWLRNSRPYLLERLTRNIHLLV